MFETPRKLYKTLAFAEGVTWTLLIAGLVIRAAVGAPPLLLTIVGGIHGLVFLAYGVSSALVGVNQRWGFWRTALAVVLAIVPYATIPFERVVEKRSSLSLVFEASGASGHRSRSRCCDHLCRPANHWPARRLA
jgi:integral membrane protein